MATNVDVVILSRGEDPINDEVLQAVFAQEGVEVQLRRVIGTPRDDDANRWETIARARNVGRALGTTPWLMFVDDDVVLGRNCIAQLLEDLAAKPSFGAIAADYLGERSGRGVSPHVAMGATLFRREALLRVEFRWEKNRCECQCMADDLRRRFTGIDYSALASAVHLSRDPTEPERHTRPAIEVVTDSAPREVDEHREGRILVAFDRSHMGLFRGQFIPGLRESGNGETVHAVTYGLRDKQIRSLRRIDGVEVHPQPYTVHRVCRSRLLGFQFALKDLCPETPVAYWDAGDVLFQTSLDPLWRRIRQTPDRLLLVEEPLPFSDNPGHQTWITNILNPTAKRRVLSLLEGKPVVNGGFVAGTADRMLRYLRKANDLINGELLGAGGGDQVVLNVCKYTRPEEFVVIDDTWNYCLMGRSGRHCKIARGKYIDVVRGRTISVVHGNADTLA